MSHETTETPRQRSAQSPDSAAGASKADPPVPAGNALDNRWARRAASRLGAQIEHPSLSTPLLCTVRDTSSTGARLELTAIRGGPISRDPVPDRFTLCMPSDRLQVDCEVAWRQGPLIGVRYVSPTRRTPRPPPKPAEPVKKPHTSLISLLINPR